MSVLGIVVSLLDAKRQILRDYIACDNPASRVRNTINAITISATTNDEAATTSSHIISGEYP
jgi:hypothetical protein